MKAARERAVSDAAKKSSATTSAPQWMAARLEKNLPTALKKLDRNGDGQLSGDEVRPNFGRGRGRAE